MSEQAAEAFTRLFFVIIKLIVVGCLVSAAYDKGHSDGVASMKEITDRILDHEKEH